MTVPDLTHRRFIEVRSLPDRSQPTNRLSSDLVQPAMQAIYVDGLFYCYGDVTGSGACGGGGHEVEEAAALDTNHSAGRSVAHVVTTRPASSNCE
jgi:hypothetical protein